MISRLVLESSAPVGSSARMIFGIVHKRTCDGDTLLLPARKLAWLVFLASGQSDSEQGFHRPLAPVAGTACRCT